MSKTTGYLAHMGQEAAHRVCKVSLEEGILIYRYAAGVTIELKDAKEVVDLGAGFVDGPKPTLVDIREVEKVTPEARDYFAGTENQLVSSSVAILVAGAVSRMIGNFFLGLNRPAQPIRIFNNEEGAREWLRNLPA